jgi:uncharacterized membrane protein
MLELLWKYLIGPIVADAQNVQQLAWNGATAVPGYNPVNTAFYAVTAVIFIFGVYRLFQRKEIDFTASTAVHTLPFIFLGGTLRFLNDAAAVPYPYSIALITPLIYFLIAAVYIPAVYRLEEKEMSYLGTFMLLPVLLYAFIHFEELRLTYLIATLGLSTALTGIYYWVAAEEYSITPLVLLAFTQLFEGSASMFSALKTFGSYSPKQLLGQIFNSLFGFPGVLIMKVMVLLLAIRVVTDIEDERMKGVALVALYSIGLGTGFRVFLRVLAGL